MNIKALQQEYIEMKHSNDFEYTNVMSKAFSNKVK